MSDYVRKSLRKAVFLVKLIEGSEAGITAAEKLIKTRRQSRIAMVIYRRHQTSNVMSLLKNWNRVNDCFMDFVDPIVAAIINREIITTRRHLRVTPDSLHLFCKKANKTKTHGWAIKFEAMVFLYWLATGVCFRVVAHCFSLATSTTHMVCANILNEIVNLVNEVIRSAVGAIDGCQVRTLVLTALHDQYINRKLYYSIKLQGVVDHRGLLIVINAGFPGSVHDMWVLRHSYLWRSGTYPPEDNFILGDGGYQTRLHPICIITPFRAPLTPDKTNFNHHHSKGPCIVEKAFGMMQVRWRAIYSKALEVKLKTSVKVIIACAIMHNICITAGDILRVDVDDPVHVNPREQLNEVEGVAFLNLLLNLHMLYRNQERNAND